MPLCQSRLRKEKVRASPKTKSWIKVGKLFEKLGAVWKRLVLLVSCSSIPSLSLFGEASTHVESSGSSSRGHSPCRVRVKMSSGNVEWEAGFVEWESFCFILFYFVLFCFILFYLFHRGSMRDPLHCADSIDSIIVFFLKKMDVQQFFVYTIFFLILCVKVVPITAKGPIRDWDRDWAQT